MNPSIKILGISGSLRVNSSNHAVVRAAARLAPDNVDFKIYEGLQKLPHFDGNEKPPDAVVDFRTQLANADGVFICTPEYAFGVPGTLKNALDWTVYTGEFYHKPVAVIAAATSGDKALASLLLTLSALTARVGEGASLLIPAIRSKINTEGGISDDSTLKSIDSVLKALIAEIERSELKDN